MWEGSGSTATAEGAAGVEKEPHSKQVAGSTARKSASDTQMVEEKQGAMVTHSKEGKGGGAKGIGVLRVTIVI